MGKIIIAVCCLVFSAYRPLSAEPLPPIYKWQDAQGQPHYSDTAPGNRKHRMIEPDQHSPVPAKGLRPGELATLRAIEQRQRKQYKTAQAARRSQRQIRSRQRQDCADARKKLQHSHIHSDSKAWSMYLREHCW